MTIEEEFFKVFSIKKVRECELRDECFLGFAHTCDKCDIYGQAYEIYPPITSDIVLNLLAMLIDNDCEIVINNFHIQLWYDNAVVYVSESNNDIKRAIIEMFIEYPPLKKLNLKVRALFNEL